jgi:hypothetical protein
MHLSQKKKNQKGRLFNWLVGPLPTSHPVERPLGLARWRWHHHNVSTPAHCWREAGPPTDGSLRCTRRTKRSTAARILTWVYDQDESTVDPVHGAAWLRFGMLSAFTFLFKSRNGRRAKEKTQQVFCLGPQLQTLGAPRDRDDVPDFSWWFLHLAQQSLHPPVLPTVFTIFLWFFWGEYLDVRPRKCRIEDGFGVLEDL